MKLLPLGFSEFEDIRQPDSPGVAYVYVDKTEGIHHLVTENKFVFFSRPRRFGKSLLLSTIASLFEGKQALFEGLWIANQWDWQAPPNPVVRIDFTDVLAEAHDLTEGLLIYLDGLGQSFQLTLTSQTPAGKLKQLIQGLHQSTGQKVVVLVDEYDKPITDFLENVPQAQANRSILQEFFVVLKSNSRFVRFLLLTGVSKFGQVSVFSGLNQLNDISLDARHASLLGYTAQELTQCFDAHFQAWATAKNREVAVLHKQFAYWYNGYSWGGDTPVYNPWSVMKALGKQAISAAFNAENRALKGWLAKEVAN